MPTYEFRCPDGHTTEQFYRKMGDAVSELECPVCGKLATRVLSGGAGLVFKGSGFYLTDYGKNAHRGDNGSSRPASAQADGAPASSDSGSGASGDSSKSDTAKAESKPAESKSGDAKSSDKSSGTKPASPPAAPTPKSDK